MVKISKETTYKIITLLTKEYEFYEDLFNLLKEERSAIINLNTDELTNLNFRKESILFNIIEIKKQREELINEIAENLQIEPDEINLTFLEKNCEIQNSKFNEFKTKFKTIGRRIKSLNETNKHILQSSINFITSSLNIIYQNIGVSTYSQYGKVSAKPQAITSSAYNGRI